MLQYFSKEGRRLRREEATDAAGLLKDGCSVRVRMQMRDSAERVRFADGRSFWDAERESLLVTDARALGGTEGCKPGFRIADSAVNATDRAAAYSDYLRDLENAWRNPGPISDTKKINRYDPGGRSEGYWEEEDDDEDKCRSTEDGGQTLDQLRAKHQQNMERVYAERDQLLRDAWRGK